MALSDAARSAGQALSGFVARVAERRRDPRYTNPQIALKIDGRTYRTDDWSLGGFSISGWRKPAQRLDRVTGKIGGGRLPSGTFVAEIVRISPDGATVACRFLEITPATILRLSEIRPY